MALLWSYSPEQEKGGHFQPLFFESHDAMSEISCSERSILRVWKFHCTYSLRFRDCSSQTAIGCYYRKASAEDTKWKFRKFGLNDSADVFLRNEYGWSCFQVITDTTKTQNFIRTISTDSGGRREANVTLLLCYKKR